MKVAAMRPCLARRLSRGLLLGLWLLGKLRPALVAESGPSAEGGPSRELNSVSSSRGISAIASVGLGEALIVRVIHNE
jgi:hypothetical protein